MYIALKRITQYMSIKQIKKSSNKDYGLSYEEMLEMSYENLMSEAKNGLKGITASEIKPL